MAVDTLLLRKGLLQDLENATKINGALNFTTDEPAIYLDVEENGEVVRKRIGDIVQFAHAADFSAYLEAHSDHLPTTALYYIAGTSVDSEDSKDKIGDVVFYNALLKWTGTTWIQINEKSDYSGDISSLQSAVNTAQAAAKAAQDEVDALEQVHADDKAALEASVKTVSDDLAAHLSAYATKMGLLDAADAKHAEDIASNTNAITEETNRATQAEEALGNRLTPVEAAVAVDGAIDQRITAAKEAAIADAKTETATQVNALANGAVKTNTDAIDSLKNLVGTEAVDSRIATAKSEAIADAKTETTTQVEAEAQARAQAITDLDTAYKAADTALDTRIQALEDNKNTVDGSINGLEERIGALEAEDPKIRAEFAAADAEVLSEAKGYAEEQAADVRGETAETVASVDAKVTALTETVNNNANAASQAVATEKSRAEGEEAKIRTEFAQADATTLQSAKDYADQQIELTLQAADAMKFKGVVNSVDGLPTTGVEAGWTYKVGTNFDLADGTKVYVGDLLIAEADQGAEDESYTGGWAHVSSGYEDDHDVHIELLTATTTVDDEEVTTNTGIKVVNAAGQERGSVEFVAGNNVAVDVAQIAKDEQSGITDVRVTVGLTWSSF